VNHALTEREALVAWMRNWCREHGVDITLLSDNEVFQLAVNISRQKLEESE